MSDTQEIMGRIKKHIECEIVKCEDMYEGHNINGDWQMAGIYKYKEEAFEDILCYIDKLLAGEGAE